MGAPKTVGAVVMNKVQAALTNKLNRKIDSAMKEKDSFAVKQLGWKILGQEELFLEQQKLTQRLEEIKDLLDPFTSWQGKHHDKYKDALAAAEETLYPEIKKLTALRDTVEERIVLCLLTDDLKQAVDQITKEIEEV